MTKDRVAAHVCEFTVYSHTSYGADERDVFLCADRDCPAWDYGPARPRPSQLAAPGMTDLMVTPESIDAYLAENPPDDTAATVWELCG